MKNYFTILQIPEGSDREEIQKAYRRLAKQYHPDVNKSPDAHEKFCEITEAYEFLMNHWPLHNGNYAKGTSYEQKYNEYRQTGEYERFRQEARERAQHQAKMRYEKFRKQHEAFQESGIDDIGLFFTILIRLISVPLFLFLFLSPIILAILVQWSLIFMILFMWPFAVGIAWYYHDNRRNYFLPGKFYYSPERVRHLFTRKRNVLKRCYYCPPKFADSVPYKIDLLKLKDIKLHMGGYRQQNVNYVNQDITIMIPRSHKAFIIHTTNIFIKLLSVAGCLIFADISSLVWRMIAGMILGGLISRILLTITGTKSNVTYLISYGLIIRVIVWLLCLGLASRFYFSPFDIYTTESRYFAITAIIVFDSLLMQLISMIFGRYASKPICVQYPETAARLEEGYIAYNDIPVFSVLYPLFKWIFG
jgi:curved DNA-binding protein CbpA